MKFSAFLKESLVKNFVRQPRRRKFQFIKNHPLILILNKMLYLKSRVLGTRTAHVSCAAPSHKNLTRFAL